MPPSMARFSTPNRVTMIPLVGGTVESQSSPMAAPKSQAEPSVTGKSTKAVMTTARAA